MPKYRVILSFTERIIEADDEDEACDLFRNDETIFYEIESEEIEDAPNRKADLLSTNLKELGIVDGEI